MTSLQTVSNRNIADILKFSVLHNSSGGQGKRALVVYDTQTVLAQILTESYRVNILDTELVDFDLIDKDGLIDKFHSLEKGDLVVLVQSSNFRLNDFRIRLNLFNRGLKVIEHMHLYRNSEASWPSYINSLAYNPTILTKQACHLKTLLSEASMLSIKYQGDECLVNSPLEIPKLNIGQYDGMANIGGTYPIGEVFTESQNLESINGRVWIYAFANSDFEVELSPSPFWLEITNGRITSRDNNTPRSFNEVLDKVELSEDLLIRELGFGINSAISRLPSLLIKDITAFERVCGMHMSIGHKHSVYKKPDYPAHKARYHIDVFVQADVIETDKQVIWRGGTYVD